MYVVLLIYHHCVCMYFFFFFFKQKTAYEMRISDWSSDVCSSDLLGLIGTHQRAAPRIAENDDRLDAGLLLEPFHADADVEHRMFEQELVLDPAIARVPAEETEALPREIGRDIMFGEIDVIMRRDDRDLGTLDRKSTRLNSSH